MSFPGTPIELDILTAVNRIEQIEREGPDSCAGIILDRLITCDARRLRSHLSQEVLDWEAAVMEL